MCISRVTYISADGSHGGFAICYVYIHVPREPFVKKRYLKMASPTSGRFCIPSQRHGDGKIKLTGCQSVVSLPNCNRGDGGHIHFLLDLIDIEEPFIASIHEVVYWKMQYNELIGLGRDFDDLHNKVGSVFGNNGADDGSAVHESTMKAVAQFFLLSEKLFNRLKGNDPGINISSMEAFLSAINIRVDIEPDFELLADLRDFHSEADPQFLNLMTTVLVI